MIEAIRSLDDRWLLLVGFGAMALCFILPLVLDVIIVRIGIWWIDYKNNKKWKK